MHPSKIFTMLTSQKLTWRNIMITFESHTIRKFALRTMYVLILLSLCLAGCANGFSSTNAATPTPPPPTGTPPPPTATKTRYPTLTKEPTATIFIPTSTTDPLVDCFPLEELNETHTGETACVYGEIVQKLFSDAYAVVLRFSESRDHFLFRSRSFYWSGVKIGDCVYVRGEIQWNGVYYFIEINEEGEGADLGYSNRCE
jgi:hypothetical protein